MTFDSMWRALLVPGVFLVLDTLHSNVITPALMGRRFTLNTPVLAGALLAVPLLSALKIVCERVQSLQRVAIFLGDGTGWEAPRLRARPPPARSTPPRGRSRTPSAPGS